MAPSASLQSRINAFETLKTSDNEHSNPNGNARLVSVSIPHKPVRYYQEQNMLDSDSTSPTADSLFSILPIQPVPSPSRPSSPAALGRKSSLIDFSELSSPNLKPVSANGTGSTTSSTSLSDSSKKPQWPPRTSPHLPPLPPRKPSITSLKVTPTTAPPPLPKRHASSPVSSSISKQLSAPSLLIPSDSHTYPPGSSGRGTSPGFQSRHMPTSSTSSFHSVSLSSDGGGDTRDSLDGSYEAVSSTAATSPTFSAQHDWEHDLQHELQPAPKLPQRTWQKNVVSPPTVNAPSATTRRPAPPPPQRRSMRSDAPSPHHRPAPLPPNAQKRYDALFERNLPQHARKGRASGWRGVSVDLLTNGERPDFRSETGRVDMLDGFAVKQIWSCSNLPRPRLREIWNECDPDGVGSLDRDAFAKGMWRIDEELSRAQQQNRPRALTFKPASIPHASRAPPPLLRKPNFPLR